VPIKQRSRDAWIALINHEGFQKVAEVGVWRGSTAFLALEKCSGVTAYTMVDPLRSEFNRFQVPDGDQYVCRMDDPEAALDQGALDRIHAQILRVVRSKYPQRASFLRSPSEVAFTSVVPYSLDAVYLDAVHMYSWTLRDIAVWLTRIKPTGWICGDDYVLQDPLLSVNPRVGVAKAVQGMFRDFEVVGGFWSIPVRKYYQQMLETSNDPE